ncbi:MAG: hypothetical protein MRQ13_05235 [Candidatus Midichloria sp.]|nr:hypothetical protein [Candidatus Midichloria sp.]
MSFLSLDGTNGFTINGIGAGNVAGAAVGRLGDVNGVITNLILFWSA